MSIARPFSKEILKKIVLKDLYEHPGGVGWDIDSIIALRIPRCLDIDDNGLSEEEQIMGRVAILELEKNGFIMPDPSQRSQNFKVVTSKGKKYASRPFNEMIIPSVDISDVITRNDLLEEVEEDYITGNFNNVINKCFKLIEYNIQDKTGLNLDINEDLILNAFDPENGSLEHLNATTDIEKKYLYQMIEGTVMWFKSSQDKMNNNPNLTIKVISFGNLLLDIIDECNLKRIEGSS